MKTVSAAEANRQFSQILRDVKVGQTVLVTSRGKLVARIEGIGEGDEARQARRRAWREHFARLRAQPALDLGRITRDEAYDD